MYAEARDDWKDTAAHFARLRAYPEFMGFQARLAILAYVDHVAFSARLHMPQSMSYSIRSVVTHILPLSFTRVERRIRVTRRDLQLFDYAIQIGETLAYDGALKCRNLRIAEDGCEILWRILSFAVIHRQRSLRERVGGAFAIALDGANRSGLLHAVSLVRVARDHGAAGGTRWPDYPEAVALAL
jgi:hypothetical protein